MTKAKRAITLERKERNPGNLVIRTAESINYARHSPVKWGSGPYLSIA
jgi:hypothetical protein